MIAKHRTAFIMLALVLLVIGCIDQPDTDSAPSRNADPLPIPAKPKDLPGSTPAGTRLRFGEKAVITIGTAEEPFSVGIIVTAIERATPQDEITVRGHLQQHDAQVDGGIHVIKGILVNEDGMNGDSYSGPNVYGVTKDGQDAGSLIMMNITMYLSSCTAAPGPATACPRPVDRVADRRQHRLRAGGRG